MDFSSLGAEKYGNADDSKGINQEGGARETVYKLRRRSRKRRSFIDSEYTSMVSFPQPGPETQPGVLTNDAQMLSLDPEPSEQTENPSPTVSSLTHSEGEPAQLESKPILPGRRPRAPDAPPAPGVHGQSREPPITCQARKQEMEMEPDSMESKSVTAAMKAATPSITVVRCRVDPDGKECSDRRGDGKEEVEGLEDTGEENVGEEKQEPGSFSGHMFLPNTSVEEGEKSCFLRTFIGAERQPEAPTQPSCLEDTDKEGQNSLLGAQVVQITAKRSTSQSYSPPPPPPSSPLPPVPAVLQREIPDQMCFSNPAEMPACQEVSAFVHEKESVHVLSPTVSSSDEITDSINSDSVFEDDEGSISLTSNSCGKKGDWSAAPHRSACIGAQTRGHQFNRDYDRAINSITEKLGAATNVTSPVFYSGTKLKSESTCESVAGESLEKLRSVDGLTALRAPRSLTKAGDDMDPPSPTRFPFQTCSPSFMGRLSASTLRGKIQQLPQYLSKSQESLNQPGGTPSPTGHHHAAENVGITVTDVDNVTQTVDLEMDTSVESVDSDDSDTTVTGSEVDGEYFMDTPSANSPPPVQTEPKAPNLHPYSGPGNNTPGPITQPPASVVNSFHRDISGAKMDTPGPAKTSPVVMTTQNANGPRLPFHAQCRAVRRTSSDRPLMGPCSLPGPKSEPSKLPPPDCRVFTICEAPAHTPAEAEPSPPFKSEPGCNSLFSSGCESFAEGVQAPLDACGCPPVYTNCFGSTDGFDEELTVFEFSCRSQSSSVTQTCGGGPLMTTPPVPSVISTSSTIPPFFPHSSLFLCSASELSPLLSPLSDASTPPLSQTHKDTISRLGQQCYPEPPAGFQALRLDVDKLLSILENSSPERCAAGRHPRELCPAHFTENKRVLQVEARRLMSGCQKAVEDEQSPGDMLRSLADSFRTLVDLAGVCLQFSGCDRCDRRNAEAVAGLADVARSFRDLCLAAERVSSKRSCQDLSRKLLAKQCTALTASVFCLTQLFRTLTAL